MKKNILRISSFVMLSIMVISVIYFCIPHGDDKVKRVRGYILDENKNLNVYAIGNSDLYSGFIPPVVYEKTKIKAYNGGQSNQNLNQTYFYLKDMYNYQSPELVCIETDVTTYPLVAIKGEVGNRIYDNHDFWRQQSSKDIKAMKGYVFSDAIKPYDFGSQYLFNDEVEIPLANLARLKDIIELCRNNGSDVLLTEFPSTTTWNEKKHNQMVEFASENNVNFIDFNYLFDEIHFDYKKCSRDGGNHMNVYGANKLSNYIADFIVKNYTFNISDNDNPSWEKSVEIFKKKTKNLNQLNTVKSF